MSQLEKDSTAYRIDKLFNPPESWQAGEWVNVFEFGCGKVSIAPTSSFIYAATFWYSEGNVILDHCLFKVIAIGRLVTGRMNEEDKSCLREDRGDLDNACYLIKSEEDGSLNWHVFSNCSFAGYQVATMLGVDKDLLGSGRNTHVTYRHLINLKTHNDSSLDFAAEQLLRRWGLDFGHCCSVIDETSSQSGTAQSELWRGLMTEW